MCGVRTEESEGGLSDCGLIDSDEDIYHNSMKRGREQASESIDMHRSVFGQLEYRRSTNQASKIIKIQLNGSIDYRLDRNNFSSIGSTNLVGVGIYI
jgi:hypothetical protein